MTGFIVLLFFIQVFFLLIFRIQRSEIRDLYAQQEKMMDIIAVDYMKKRAAE